MRETALAIFLAVAGVLAAPPATYTVNTDVTSLPSGVKAFVTIGGDGCNCTGAGSGTAGSGGMFSVSITITCQDHGRPPDNKPSASCSMMSRAEDQGTGKNYKGSDKPTVTSSGAYVATIVMK